MIKSFDVISTGPGNGIPAIVDLSAPRLRGYRAAHAATHGNGDGAVQKLHVVRSAHNPIVVPGGYAWRNAVTFNPGVLLDDRDGRFYMYERAAGSLRPFRTCIGALVSEDGVNFKPASPEPVFTSEMLGLPHGSVEDARVVKIDGRYLMCYAMQPYRFDCWPSGTGLPEYQTHPEWDQNQTEPMITRSGIAVSDDGLKFKQLCWTTPPEIDDRDNVLFPEKINGMYALLRRPMHYVGPQYGTDRPGIWLSFSEDLFNWSPPKLVAVAENLEWEGTKIGAAASPLKTDVGWLLLYHGVDESSVYRVGSMMLDLRDPTKVIGRTRSWIMEPEAYYERIGLVIPNVVFPTATILKDGLVYIYYGCCDTSIALATVPLDELIECTMQGK